MVTRFLAESLDLSRLPDPTLIAIDYEQSVTDRKAALVAAFAAAGIDYDVATLETDPGVILEEVDAYREILALQAINEAGLANMLAFSRGADLDNLAANVGVSRAITGYDEDNQPVYETDERLRRRAQLAPEAFSTAGAAGAYLFHALTADPTVADASVENPAPGEVIVNIMGNGEDPTATPEQVEKVRAHLFRDDIKPLTDILTVRGATVIAADIVADLILYPGPDAALVVTDARKTLDAFLAQNKKLGRDLKRGAWIGRLFRDTVQGVNAISPVADVPAAANEVVWIQSVNLTSSGRDE